MSRTIKDMPYGLRYAEPSTPSLVEHDHQRYCRETGGLVAAPCDYHRNNHALEFKTRHSDRPLRFVCYEEPLTWTCDVIMPAWWTHMKREKRHIMSSKLRQGRNLRFTPEDPTNFDDI